MASRTFKYSRRVAEWKEEVRAQLDEVFGPCEHPMGIDDVLSIIHVESSGNPKAHRPFSQFYGLTQIGRSTAKDIGHKNKDFHGDGPLAIKGFLLWAKRYAKYHHYVPMYMAIGWKGGVGTLKEYLRRIKRGQNRTIARQWLDAERWNTWRYVRKFNAAKSIWSSDTPALAEPVKVKF